jgi:hypothetical protein
MSQSYMDSQKEPVFAVGQTVKATGPYSHQITEGKLYKVIDYAPACTDRSCGFTWPPYVTVIGDFGRPVTGHTYRFKAVDGEGG